MLFFVFGSCFPGFIASVCTCQPRRRAWDPTVPGTCINLVVFALAGSALQIATDIAILLLPIPLVWKLKLPVRQRGALIAIFAAGSLYEIASSTFP